MKLSFCLEIYTYNYKSTPPTATIGTRYCGICSEKLQENHRVFEEGFELTNSFLQMSPTISYILQW